MGCRGIPRRKPNGPRTSSAILRALRRAGLVTSRRQGKMVLYRLTDEGSRLLAAVLAPARVPVR
jgi:DNA-binding transcriptional ArsR family regulator